MKIRCLAIVFGFWQLVSVSAYGMGLRSLVALPVETDGGVIRLGIETAKTTDIFVASAAYGVNAQQTLLVGVPYKRSSLDKDEFDDVSTLLRYSVWRRDRFSGTSRLGLLGGFILPTHSDRDWAAQAGFVFTHFKNRHEIDFDVLYRSGFSDRQDSGRYDLSWQYRISPTDRPEWGITSELNTVLELNGRWIDNLTPLNQITLGLQSVHQLLVLDGGIIRGLNKDKNLQLVLGVRFHY